MDVYLQRAPAAILNSYVIKSGIFTSSVEGIWSGVGYFNRAGPEIGYFNSEFDLKITLWTTVQSHKPKCPAMSIYMYECKHVSMYISMYVYCMYMCGCACMNVSMYVCMYDEGVRMDLCTILLFTCWSPMCTDKTCTFDKSISKKTAKERAYHCLQRLGKTMKINNYVGNERLSECACLCVWCC